MSKNECRNSHGKCHEVWYIIFTHKVANAEIKHQLFGILKQKDHFLLCLNFSSHTPQKTCFNRINKCHESQKIIPCKTPATQHSKYMMQMKIANNIFVKLPYL